MALLEDVDAADRQHPLTAKIRGELGDIEFLRRLAQTPEAIHAAAKDAFVDGDRAQHERLLHIGWLQNRVKLKQAAAGKV